MCVGVADHPDTGSMSVRRENWVAEVEEKGVEGRIQQHLSTIVPRINGATVHGTKAEVPRETIEGKLAHRDSSGSLDLADACCVMGTT